MTYTPDADYRSVKSFTYAASDGEGLTADDPVGLRAIPEDLIAATARSPPGKVQVSTRPSRLAVMGRSALLGRDEAAAMPARRRRVR